MTHAVIGYPSLALTTDIVLAMEKGGADFIELQIPFSDPLADGPIIMHACERALRQGTKVSDAFTVATALKGKISIPLLFMAYYNTVFKFGVEKFCQKARKAGVLGLIVPDMPLEEETHEHLARYAKENNLHLIRMIAPVSDEKRLIKNAAVAEGFVYCSARQGITGVRKELPPNIVEYLKEARRFFDVPLAVGFGISKPEHVKKIAGHADIAVVGSAIIDLISKSDSKSLLPNITHFIRKLKISHSRQSYLID